MELERLGASRGRFVAFLRSKNVAVMFVGLNITVFSLGLS